MQGATWYISAICTTPHMSLGTHGVTLDTSIINKCVAEASGLLRQLQKMSFAVCLVVFEKLLSLTQVVHEIINNSRKKHNVVAGIIDCHQHC